MTAPKVAVVGGGVAGVSAALSASTSGAATTLVESSKRIGLSKALTPFLMSDGWSERDLILARAGELAACGVEARTGETVSSIQRERGKLRVEFSSGRASSSLFDSVVICTGASSQTTHLRGSSKPNVFILKEPADYLRLSSGLDGIHAVVVSGPVPLALKLGEILADKGKSVKVYCGKEGLDRQFSGPVAVAIRREASNWREEGRVSLVDDSVESILGVDRAEAVVSSGSVLTCDAVVVIPRSAPSFPAVDCKLGRSGGLLVDASMSTSLPGVYAAGDSAEIKFKSGSVAARLYSTSRMGGEVAGINAAGGRAQVAPSWTLEQTYFGLEFCSSGLSEAEASAMGLEAVTGTGVSRDAGPRGTGQKARETLVSIVYDRSSHEVYGLEIAGWRASVLSAVASIIVALGLTVEQLVHLESPYSPGSSPEVSPIALTAGKIPELEGSRLEAQSPRLRRDGRRDARVDRRL